MTPGPTPLQEQVAEALLYRDTLHPAIASDLAAAVLPIIAAEVRKAQADAWDRAIRALNYPDGSPVEVLINDNPYRSEED